MAFVQHQGIVGELQSVIPMPLAARAVDKSARPRTQRKSSTSIAAGTKRPLGPVEDGSNIVGAKANGGVDGEVKRPRKRTKVSASANEAKSRPAKRAGTGAAGRPAEGVDASSAVVLRKSTASAHSLLFTADASASACWIPRGAGRCEFAAGGREVPGGKAVLPADSDSISLSVFEFTLSPAAPRPRAGPITDNTSSNCGGVALPSITIRPPAPAAASAAATTTLLFARPAVPPTPQLRACVGSGRLLFPPRSPPARFAAYAGSPMTMLANAARMAAHGGFSAFATPRCTPRSLLLAHNPHVGSTAAVAATPRTLALRGGVNAACRGPSALLFSSTDKDGKDRKPTTVAAAAVSVDVAKAAATAAASATAAAVSMLMLLPTPSVSAQSSSANLFLDAPAPKASA